MQTLQTVDFIAEARRRGSFYTGIANVLNDPKGDEDFKFLATALDLVNSEERYSLEAAAVAAIGQLHCEVEDPEELRKRAFALVHLILTVSERGINVERIKALIQTVSEEGGAIDEEAVTQ